MKQTPILSPSIHSHWLQCKSAEGKFALLMGTGCLSSFAGDFLTKVCTGKPQRAEGITRNREGRAYALAGPEAVTVSAWRASGGDRLTAGKTAHSTGRVVGARIF